MENLENINDQPLNQVSNQKTSEQSNNDINAHEPSDNKEHTEIKDENSDDEKCPVWIGEEADRVAARARKVFRRGDAAFLLLTDTHYAISCNWPDTLSSLGAVADRLQMQGVIHLGDLTDGLLPDFWTRRYAGRVLDGLHSLGLPYDGCLGNHDSNYFRNNRGIMAGEDLARFYLNRSRPYYHKDFPEQRIRMYFLDSFDPGRQQRYGFSDEELGWLRRSLRKVPGGYRLLFFSHVPPLARLHVWSDEILNEKKLLQILNEYQKNGGKILAWIHGHNHADQVTGSPEFPIVSIGCSKTEAFAEHKPRGSVTYERRLDEPRQELWDILICHAGRHELDLVRFGAGKDRHIEAFV